MDSSEERFETLSKNIEEYEKKARRRAWISSIVPTILGLLLLGYTVWQIQAYGEKLAGVQVELTKQTDQLNAARGTLEAINGELNQSSKNLDELKFTATAAAQILESGQQELEKTKKELELANQELIDTNLFLAYKYPVDFEILKEGEIYFSYSAQESILFYILDLQAREIMWKRNGFSETEGFDSPNFTLYVLKEFGLVSSNYGAGAEPWKILKPANKPSVGDIVYYENGFSMFYYELNGEPFVIGMTPTGIVSLKPEFMANPRYLCVPYDPTLCQ